ncbi:hypothetical protein CCMSSC00406_0005871 [Pleurotus cornucopiae]|uniref:Uncharacterized protein n=1 Tax=Pleurotus cornucopiae TaxID=5321 RepID=A0ACB7J796_PLECO|nr:hypothetical protein CCMSSC00406_0005871 [Pleurotus cornucopiae]
MYNLYQPFTHGPSLYRRRNPNAVRAIALALSWTFLLLCVWVIFAPESPWSSAPRWKTSSSLKELYYARKNTNIARCKSLNDLPPTADAPVPGIKPPARSRSDRYEPSRDEQFNKKKKYVKLKNGKLWTGRLNGTEVIQGDVVFGEGIIKLITASTRYTPAHSGYTMHVEGDDIKGGGEWGVVRPEDVSEDLEDGESVETEVIDVKGAWITPGLVDLHSHIGVSSLPQLSGASDGNSHNGPILPFLRSIDGLNTHDESYILVMAGGVTTAQVLPGSANNIGGQSFVIKLRPTNERSVISKVVEPPYTLLNESRYGEGEWDFEARPRWRHMKHACGENPDRRYGFTRMDAAWAYRNAYNEAKKIKDQQDEFCSQVLNGDLRRAEEEFPESPLETEALVDVLRGRVKLSIHCYEVVDLDMIVRLSNEFKFPIASLHHTGETYLVPELLRQTWGGAPATALFAANARKKREAYRNSEFAPKVLADHNIPVVMKSDHPVLNSRYLLYEAQQAHFYGLNSTKALESVTTTPAKAAGLGHRLGYISEGYDADIVVWDSHPLTLGATPQRVYIDGILQINDSRPTIKPEELQVPPKTPDFEKEAREAVKSEGLPPLEASIIIRGKVVVLKNLSTGYIRDGGRVKRWFPPAENAQKGEQTKVWDVVVRDGSVLCHGVSGSCAVSLRGDGFNPEDFEEIDLEGGVILPGLTTFGSSIGLTEIAQEPTTNDGNAVDPFSATPPLLGGPLETIVRAADGLQFGGRNTLLAYRGGVTQAIVAPVGSRFVFGFATAFSTAASNALEQGAVIQNTTALHMSITHQNDISVSTQIAALRRSLLQSAGERQLTDALFVIHVDSADIMATLIKLKREYYKTTGQNVRFTFAGGTEAHLLADDIAKENISVILTPSRPFPVDWDKRRILPGPPLTSDTQISYLLRKGINVGLGTVDDFDARNARFDAEWARVSSRGYIDSAKAIELVTVNLERALGVTKPNSDMIALKGGSIGFEGKLFSVTSKRRGVVEILL